MKVSRSEKVVYRFLMFWSAKGAWVTLFVIIGSFLFVSLFGNYPQWKQEDYNKALIKYFDPLLENVTYTRMQNGDNSTKLFFSYSDGSDLSKEDFERADKQDIVNAWKIDILNLVCVHDDFRAELKMGRSIEIDLKDGDSFNGKGHIANMRIYEERC
ncbi:hypothetical protein ISG33_14295 [Glaciecola sp. MH2013]|uniref:hypothetical protein n=1 Tax=Glaciecola sp. MH2013 TaxID=2785524 RepID=UPI00189C6D4A|nr:hypothetical protein [Glaciecola sp. MH2013]MBF7074572.1 hypothetical protein [Glaciecola sp. MH2013]